VGELCGALFDRAPATINAAAADVLQVLLSAYLAKKKFSKLLKDFERLRGGYWTLFA